MFPGQRTSRRNQELESMAMDATDHGDYDDYGMPSRPASGASKSKSGKLLGRFRKQASSANLASQMDGDSDEEDAYVPPGSGAGAYAPQQGQFQVQHAGQFASQGQFGQGQFGQGQFQQYTPQPADTQYAPPTQASAEPGSASPNLPGPQGDISMDQISSIRDRHRYPGFDDDAKSGRAMSLNSMSAYDTTPIIPMLGPVTNFQSGSTHNRATPQEKYRQRMIESRRALLSSETAIPLSGPPQPSRPPGQSDTYLANLAGVPSMNGTPRSMSLSSNSPNGQGGPAGPALHNGPIPSSRSMTMMSGPPAPLRGQPGPHGPPGPHPGSPMHYNGPYGSPYNAPMPGMGPGMPPMSGLPPRPPSNQGAAWNARPQGNYPQHPVHQGSASHGTLPGMGHPGMGHPGMAPGRSPGMGAGPEYLPPQGYPRGPSGPQQGSPGPQGAQGSRAPVPQPQYDTSSDAFDFGPEYTARQGAASESTSNAPAHNEDDRQKIEELSAKLSEREEEIRMLSIELAESSRRELHLAPVHDEDAQARAAALAKAHDELSLERARRAAVEEAARNPDVAVHDKLADMDHRHSEAVHLLAIRTEQYEKLQKKHASLSADYEQRVHDHEALAARFKETEVKQRTQHQDQLLGQQVQTLEIENAKLRKQIDEASPQGRLNERVVDLEEQRKALQETLRTMRERKDSEINALRSRLEQLQLQVQQQQQQRGRISSAGSASAPNSAASESTGHSFRPTPVRVMSRQPSTDSIGSPGDENRSLSMPRMRDTPARPASPLHLRINYERREAV